jgi:thiol-disulfide isomerase/thioredoxin
MKKMLGVQLGLLTAVAVILGGVLAATTIYSDVQDNIVKVLCLSCIKLEPRTTAAFTFQTATGGPHPELFRTRLANGPIMIMYSEDVCLACEEMYPVVRDLMNVTFDKYGFMDKPVVYQGMNMTFLYINIDHAPSDFRDTRPIYDKDHVDGLPMFTFITLGYDQGTIRPYYTSVYGTLGLSTAEQREAYLASLLQDSIHLYHDNRIGYQP